VFDVIGRSVAVKRSKGERVSALFSTARYEVIPLAGVEEDVVSHVPKDIKLTVTSSPKLGVNRTLEFCEGLSEAGYSVVPHLAARLVADEVHLAEILFRLRERDVNELFVIAGDAEEPVGKFDGAGPLLRAMGNLDHTVEKIGISGYPESHPVISDEATIRAMEEKAPYATHIISQICFDAKVTGTWIEAMRSRGIELPLYIGVPGVVGKQKLMRISSKIGLGESARFLRKNRGWLLKIFSGGYSPNRLIENLAPTIEDPKNGVAGLHIYTFNELAKTEKWRRETLERLGEKNEAERMHVSSGKTNNQ
jgi:methylenetetrahydrofolate reductase (NADPH)